MPMHDAPDKIPMGRRLSHLVRNSGVCLLRIIAIFRPSRIAKAALQIPRDDFLLVVVAVLVGGVA